VFQEQLITGERAEERSSGVRDVSREADLSLMETQLGAMVDLQQSVVFEEPFYIVVLERTNKGTVVHMWRLVIASQPEPAGNISHSLSETVACCCALHKQTNKLRGP
jgi:hypothetical protein